MRNNYYIPYVEKSQINYIYLLYLYTIAVINPDLSLHPYNELERAFYNKEEISFRSWLELERMINTNKKLLKYHETDDNGNILKLISDTTLKRHFGAHYSEKGYSPFLSYSNYGKNNHTIILNNNFSNYTKKNTTQFIILNPTIINLLLETKDNLLAKYVIYLKHYCDISQDKTTDFTANQFLKSNDKCCKSGSIKTQLSSYNVLLQERGIITIKKWRDECGNERNTYSMK